MHYESDCWTLNDYDNWNYHGIEADNRIDDATPNVIANVTANVVAIVIGIGIVIGCDVLEIYKFSKSPSTSSLLAHRQIFVLNTLSDPNTGDDGSGHFVFP